MTDTILATQSISAVASDYRRLLSERLPFVRSLVKGRSLLVEELISNNGPNSHKAERWVCFAHQGTLDKLERLFVGEGKIGDFEVIGAARNLFENLVWCLLFRADVEYGLVFNYQLLCEQIKSIESHIAKIDSEIKLFAELESVEDSKMSTLLDRLTREEIDTTQFRALLNETATDVDARARVAFAIYGSQAVYNGYGYQQYLLIKKTKPKLELELQSLKSDRQVLEAEMSKSSKDLRNKIGGARRMNWSMAAEKIGMKDEYDFVYSFASKMLHSTALSTMPNGQLSDGEAILMLEYSYVAASRILDCLGKDAMSTVPDLSLITLDET